jgi:MYXO-CTERM domain-containing protein
MTCAAKEPAGAACVSDDACTNSCDTTNLCSGYAGCAVAPVTPRGTLLAVLALALAAAVTRRRKR